MLPSNKCLMKRGFRPRKKLPFMQTVLLLSKGTETPFRSLPYFSLTAMTLWCSWLQRPCRDPLFTGHIGYMLLDCFLWAWYKGSAGHRSSWRAWPSSLSFNQSTVSALSPLLRQWSALIKFDILVLLFVFHSCHPSAALLPTSLGKNISKAELEVKWTAEDFPQ